MKNELTRQINTKSDYSRTLKSNENYNDLQNLQQAQNMFVAEERALQAKRIRDK